MSCRRRARRRRHFLTTIFPVWLALMVAFGIGVRRAAGGRRALRVTGNLLVAHGIVALLWLAFPMTSRADITAGAPAATNDVGHIVMTAVTVAFILSQIGFSATAFGWRFRLYATVSAVAVVVFGTLTGIQARTRGDRRAHALDGPRRTAQHRAMAAVDGRAGRDVDDGQIHRARRRR